MIDPREITERAGELSLQPQIVEKDYILGWVLAGIGSHPEIRETWVFKGGTCLKKVHFETYRFSEDLDFTLTREDQLDEGFLRETFSEIAGWIYEQSGIEIPREQIRFEAYTNKRGGRSAEGRLYYRGPLPPPGSLPRIKLDLTIDETVVLEPTRQRVGHPYTDEPSEGIVVRCYPFTEVFAEKIRALGERGRPRDLYDVINLFRREEARESAAEVHDVLEAKCRYKGIAVPTIEMIGPHRDELEADWEGMLKRQLPQLPPFETFWDELPLLLAWLETREAPAPPPSFAGRPGDEIIRPSTGSSVALGLPTGSLETIRFAGANHLCVELDYVDERGRFGTRTIEPYSLRRTTGDDVILHAVRTDDGEHRSYRVDRIRGARVTNRSFAPRYAVELSPGFQVIPQTGQRSVRPPTASTRPRRRAIGSPSVRYVYQCPYCTRRFTRQRQDPRLRRHKDGSGWPCSGAGQAGHLVDMRY